MFWIFQNQMPNLFSWLEKPPTQNGCYTLKCNKIIEHEKVVLKQIPFYFELAIKINFMKVLTLKF